MNEGNCYTVGAVLKLSIDFKDAKGPVWKYGVVLNTQPDPSGRVVLAITTSKGHRYQSLDDKPRGEMAYRIDTGQARCFPVTTWVQYDHVMTPSRADLDDCRLAKTANYEQHLSEDLMRRVLFGASVSRQLDTANHQLVRSTIADLDLQRSQDRGSALAVARTQEQDRAVGPTLAEEVVAHGSEAVCGLLGYTQEQLKGYLVAPTPRHSGDIRAALALLDEERSNAGLSSSTANVSETMSRYRKSREEARHRSRGDRQR